MFRIDTMCQRFRFHPRRPESSDTSSKVTQMEAPNVNVCKDSSFKISLDAKDSADRANVLAYAALFTSSIAITCNIELSVKEKNNRCKCRKHQSSDILGIGSGHQPAGADKLNI